MDENHVSTGDDLSVCDLPSAGKNGNGSFDARLPDTFVNEEVGGVNRWVSTRSNKSIPPKRYGDVASSLISFWVDQ